MAGKTIFLDTNGWLALLNSSDHLHRSADLAWRDLGNQGCSIVLTDWIIAETGNGLARTPLRDRFSLIAERLFADAPLPGYYDESSVGHRGIAHVPAREDKQWGLVDCASFLVMKEERITLAFTTDRHFEQAGFKATLL